MAKPNSFQAVIEALGQCIAEAPDKQKDALAQALENYAATYAQSYRDLTGHRAMPALRNLIQEMVEASEARLGDN
jgi:hypothetical protein